MLLPATWWPPRNMFVAVAMVRPNIYNSHNNHLLNQSEQIVHETEMCTHYLGPGVFGKLALLGTAWCPEGLTESMGKEGPTGDGVLNSRSPQRHSCVHTQVLAGSVQLSGVSQQLQ